MIQAILTINKAIGGILESYLKHKPVAIFGLTEPTIGTSRDERIPAIISHNGEVYPTFPDDSRVLTLYHTCTSKTYVADGGYGNHTRLIETYELSLVVCGYRRFSNPMALEEEITKTMQSLSTSAMEITPVSSNFDKSSVWSQDYSGIEMPLNSEFFLFKINYRVRQPQMSCKPNH